MTKRARSGFTLIELLVVIGIMGMMGTVSVGAYRAMREGMEERTVMQNASQFIRLTYQRSQIDMQPCAIYFWNELKQEETDLDTLKVCGRAVAVRRRGRITERSGKYLIDEFGDLRELRGLDSRGNQTTGDPTDGPWSYLYKVDGQSTTFARSRVAQVTVDRTRSGASLLFMGGSDTIPPGGTDPYVSELGSIYPERFAFYMDDAGGINWEVGDPYGVEFAELELPVGYIFKSSFPTRSSSPVTEVEVVNFNPIASSDGRSETMQICALRPGSNGALAAKPVGTTVAPSQEMLEQ